MVSTAPKQFIILNHLQGKFGFVSACAMCVHVQMCTYMDVDVWGRVDMCHQMC